MGNNISLGGLATGLDTNALVTQLMYLERAPERILTQKKTAIQSKIDIYNQITGFLNSFKSMAAGMNTASTFMGKTSSVGDSTVLTATALSSAAPGSHSVSVTTLAKSERQVSDQGYASADALNFKTGSITITGLAAPITIAEGQNSLNGIAAAINGSGANVTAAVMNDGSLNPYRLVITAKDTGKNYTVDFAGLTTDPVSGTTYANPTITKAGPAYQAGTSASFTVNGIPITKTSNTVSDVIPGVTLNLLKEGGTTTVTVGNDDAGVTKKINDFMGAYNTAMAQINKQSEYNATSKKGGVLSGDSTLRTVKAQLQNVISTPVTGITGKYSTMAEIGITSNAKDGTLTLDSAKLSEALSTNFNDVVDLFTKNGGVSGLSTDKYGVAEQFNKIIDQLTHLYEGPSSTSNGIISSRVRGLSDSIKDIDTQIDGMEARMERKEAALKKQFTAMEGLVSNLQTQGNSLLSVLSRLQ
ncbi:MAG: flagellar cap protein FliD [Desulfuromonadales bacterium]|nr:MAG: flagellar cap protein FliD [Desulfuromonadales bacterium]